jgi:hypothetical protein
MAHGVIILQLTDLVRKRKQQWPARQEFRQYTRWSLQQHAHLESIMSDHPPEGLPAYRILTGPDDASFCRCVSAALEQGYLL